MSLSVAEEQGDRGQERGHKYASLWAIFVEKLWHLLQVWAKASVIPLPFCFQVPPSSSSSWSSSRTFSRLYTVHTHPHTQDRAKQHMHQTAIVVRLWCIKTNISSLQINYQLSPWPASVISLSGSRSDGPSSVLSLPLNGLTAISSSAMVFQLLIPSLHHHHPVPLMLCGERGRTCETITPWIGFVSKRIKSCFIMGRHHRKSPSCARCWHNVDVKRLVEYQCVRIKCSVTVKLDINMMKWLRWHRMQSRQNFDQSSTGYLNSYLATWVSIWTRHLYIHCNLAK